MGVLMSKEARAQLKVNNQINKAIRQHENETVIKLLLLGSGECGKSTILKQMRILHNQKFTEEEFAYRKAVVYINVVQSMAAMLSAMQNMGIYLQFVTNEKHSRTIMDIMEADEKHQDLSTQNIHEALKCLWRDGGVQQCYSRSNEYQLNDSAKYFLEALDRIYALDYRPTVDDILRTRVATMGICEVSFEAKKAWFRVFDVGGQKSERRKWIHCFDDVHAVIYIVAASEYDQVLREDGVTNRLVDSLNLFEQICNSVWFTKTSFVLFLNKTDLFAEKIQRAEITTAFPDYKGKQNYEESMEFIKERFLSRNQNPKSKIHAHETCATNTNQVQLVLFSVTDFIISKNQRGVGFS